MAIQRRGLAHGRGPERVEQPRRRLRHQAGGDHLGPGRGELRRHQGGALLLAAGTRRAGGLLDRLRHLARQRLRGRGDRGDLAEHLQDLRILPYPVGVAMAVGAGAGRDRRRGVLAHCRGDPGVHGDQHQLVHGGLVAEPVLEGDDVPGVEPRAVVDDRAGPGELLPEPVPVVAARDRGLDQRHHGDVLGPVGRLDQGVRVVGEVGAGGVELPARHLGVLALDRDLRALGASLHGADLRPGVPDHRPVGDPSQPSLPELGVRCDQEVLDEGDVPAPDLGEVRIGGGQVHQQRGQLPEGGTQATRLDRQAHGPEAGLGQGAHGAVGQGALALPVQGPLGDGLDDGGEAGAELGERGHRCPFLGTHGW